MPIRQQLLYFILTLKWTGHWEIDLLWDAVWQHSSPIDLGATLGHIQSYMATWGAGDQTQSPNWEGQDTPLKVIAVILVTKLGGFSVLLFLIPIAAETRGPCTREPCPAALVPGEGLLVCLLAPGTCLCHGSSCSSPSRDRSSELEPWFPLSFCKISLVIVFVPWGAPLYVIAHLRLSHGWLWHNIGKPKILSSSRSISQANMRLSTLKQELMGWGGRRERRGEKKKSTRIFL